MTQVKMGLGNVIFSYLGPTRGQYVFFTTPSIFCMFFSTFNIMIFGDSASYYWNNYAQWLDRNTHLNKNAGRKRHIALYGAHKGPICQHPEMCMFSINRSYESLILLFS